MEIILGFLILTQTFVDSGVRIFPRPYNYRQPTRDSNWQCCEWAARNLCDEKPQFMRVNCQKSCGTPGCSDRNYTTCRTFNDPVFIEACRPWNSQGCLDELTDCNFWASRGGCQIQASLMFRVCRFSCRHIRPCNLRWAPWRYY